MMTTLDEIVVAAAKVFRTKGYHAATVRDIAEEVGILKGSLYHHFKPLRRSPRPICRQPKSCAGRFWHISKPSIAIIRIFLSICASARQSNAGFAR